MPNKSISIKTAIIIVAYGHEESIGRTLDAIQRDIEKGDSVILVDNHPDHKSAHIARKHPVVTKVIESQNDGFGAGCNKAAEHAADADLLYFLNPDAVPLDAFLTEIKKAYKVRPNWAAWMSLLVLNDGKVNSAGNVVHISGLSWVASFGASADDFAEPQTVKILSGACMAIRKTAWEEIGGFTEEYFLYYEDTELSSRLRIKGYELGLWPQSKVLHDYAFSNGAHKWIYLERNRYMYIATCWPAVVLVLMLPVVLVTDLGLWLISVMQGRFKLRLKALWLLIKIAPKLLGIRRRIQKNRKLSNKVFLEELVTSLDNPFLGKISQFPLLPEIFALYKKAALIILR